MRKYRLPGVQKGVARTLQDYFDVWEDASSPLLQDHSLFHGYDHYDRKTPHRPCWKRRGFEWSTEARYWGKGPVETLHRLLWAKTPEETFIVWMKAFIRQDYQSHRGRTRNSHLAIRDFFGAEEMLLLTKTLEDIPSPEYHQACTTTLPIDLIGPSQYERIRPEGGWDYTPSDEDDFIILCAQTRLVIHATYRAWVPQMDIDSAFPEEVALVSRPP